MLSTTEATEPLFLPKTTEPPRSAARPREVSPRVAEALAPVSLPSGLRRFREPARFASPFRRVRVVVAYDPLRSVPQGSYTLQDYDYDAANLCQREFYCCELRKLNEVA